MTPARPSFEAVYTAELDYVLSALCRLGIPDSALDDVAHEVFIQVHRKLPTYEPSRALRPWLFGVALRQASNWRQRAMNRNELPAAQELPDAADERTPEQDVEAAQARKLVLRALERLDEGKRAIFILHELDGQPVPAAAEALELPVNTAWSRLRAARVEFSRHLTELAQGLGGNR
jgi:RNA polymerase sigma-70 factor, ECF subfamily